MGAGEELPIPASVMRSCLAHAQRRASMQRHFLGQLQDAVAGPLVRLPFIESGVDTREAVEELADQLERELSRAPAAA